MPPSRVITQVRRIPEQNSPIQPTFRLDENYPSSLRNSLNPQNPQNSQKLIFSVGMLCEIAHLKTQKKIISNTKHKFKHSQNQPEFAKIHKITQVLRSFKRFFGPRDSCDNHTWTLISRNNQNVEHPNSFQFENGYPKKAQKFFFASARAVRRARFSNKVRLLLLFSFLFFSSFSLFLLFSLFFFFLLFQLIHAENTRILRKNENLLRLAAPKCPFIKVKTTNFLRILLFYAENTRISWKIENLFRLAAPKCPFENEEMIRWTIYDIEISQNLLFRKRLFEQIERHQLVFQVIDVRERVLSI